MALKITRIEDFCGKSSGLADFENVADRGSAVIFDADSGLCLSYVGILNPTRNFDHRSFFSLGYIWAKLTVACTCSSFPLNLYPSVFGCGCGFGFEQKF